MEGEILNSLMLFSITATVIYSVDMVFPLVDLLFMYSALTLIRTYLSQG